MIGAAQIESECCWFLEERIVEGGMWHVVSTFGELPQTFAFQMERAKSIRQTPFTQAPLRLRHAKDGRLVFL